MGVISIIISSLCPFLSHHALLSKASVLVRASYHVIAVYDLIGGRIVEPQRWKPPRGERRANVNLRDRKPRSAVYRGPYSGCSAEMSVCSLVCVACKNRQATVNQLTANTNLRCEQQRHLSLRRVSNTSLMDSVSGGISVLDLCCIM